MYLKYVYEIDFDNLDILKDACVNVISKFSWIKILHGSIYSTHYIKDMREGFGKIYETKISQFANSNADLQNKSI